MSLNKTLASTISGGSDMAPKVCPESRLYGVVSLLEMLNFAAEDFYDISQQLMLLSQVVVDEEAAQLIIPRLEELWRHCKKLGLDSADAQLRRIREVMISGKCTGNLFKSMTGELSNRIRDELEARLFYCVPRERQKYVNEVSWLETLPLMGSFPTSWNEILSAGRCYAYGESTASVFHSMRALEVGLDALAFDLNVQIKKPDWQNIIDLVESEIAKINGPHAGSDWKARQKFYSDAATGFRYFKNAWRNHVMHVRDTYNDNDAHRILENVLDFLLVISKKLKERKLAAVAP